MINSELLSAATVEVEKQRITAELDTIRVLLSDLEPITQEAVLAAGTMGRPDIAQKYVDSDQRIVDYLLQRNTQLSAELINLHARS